jgi:hypothetical protein
MTVFPIALALASTLNPYPVTPVFDGWPPPRFQIMPDKAVHILFGRVAINAECGYAQWPLVIEACSQPDEKLLIMPDPCKFPAEDNYARLMCHELGHLARWPGTHGP